MDGIFRLISRIPFRSALRWIGGPYTAIDRLYLGDNLVNAVYIGDTSVTKVYLGDKQIFPSN